MKKSLREKLISEIEKIDKRCLDILNNEKQYRDQHDYQSALKCDVKYSELQFVSSRLKEILN